MERRSTHGPKHIPRHVPAGGWALCLALAAVPQSGAHAGPQSQSYARAVAYDLAGDAAKAFPLYLEAARAGLPEAQFDVALMYDSGRGIARDESQAALYFAFAAINGSAPAAARLGRLYAIGEGVPRNPLLAAAWLVKASGPGPSSSQADAPAAGGPVQPPAPPTLLYPPEGASIDRRQSDLPLVWASTDDAAPTSYYVQLVSLAGATVLPVLTETTNLSAMRAPVGRQPGRYAWRVFAFCQSEGVYAASDWVVFEVRA